MARNLTPRHETNLLDFTLPQLTDHFAAMGEKPFRATQVMRWMHQMGTDDFSAMTDLAKTLRAKLEACAEVRAAADDRAGFHRRHAQVAAGCGHGQWRETVFIPEDDRARCVRVQPGGLRAGMHVLLHRPSGLQLAICPPPRSSVSCGGRTNPWASPRKRAGDFQCGDDGHGEPLANYDNVVAAMQIMLDDHGYGLSRRRVTLSTSGLVPALDRLREDCPVALAVSPHAPNDALRDQIVPINKNTRCENCWPPANVICSAPRDFVTFEYVMLDGVNDTPEHARQLLALVKAVP